MAHVRGPAVRIVGTGTISDEPGEGYSAADRSAFMDGCGREGSSRGRCACLYDYISARLSHDEFAGVHSDDPDRWPAHVRHVTDDAAATCDGGQPEPEDPATETAIPGEGLETEVQDVARFLGRELAVSVAGSSGAG